MVKIKGKVFKVGTSYAIRIKKALVDSEVFKEGEEIELQSMSKDKCIKNLCFSSAYPKEVALA